MPSAPQRLPLTRPRTPRVSMDQVGRTPLVVWSPVPPFGARCTPRFGSQGRPGPTPAQFLIIAINDGGAGGEPTAGAWPIRADSSAGDEATSTGRDHALSAVFPSAVSPSLKESSWLDLRRCLVAAKRFAGSQWKSPRSPGGSAGSCLPAP